MSEQLRTILIIIVSVSIFGLLVFVFVKNYIKNKLNYYLNVKNNNNYKQTKCYKPCPYWVSFFSMYSIKIMSYGNAH